MVFRVNNFCAYWWKMRESERCLTWYERDLLDRVVIICKFLTLWNCWTLLFFGWRFVSWKSLEYFEMCESWYLVIHVFCCTFWWIPSYQMTEPFTSVFEQKKGRTWHFMTWWKNHPKHVFEKGLGMCRAHLIRFEYVDMYVPKRHSPIATSQHAKQSHWCYNDSRQKTL